MELMTNTVFALVITTIAGFSTCIGSTIAYFIKKPKVKYLAFSLGFSAGVMIYVSFMEMMPIAIETIDQTAATVVFFCGIGFMALIDFIIPDVENPDHFEKLDEVDFKNSGPLMRSGLFTAFAIGVHNFPEGLATFGAAMTDTKLGIFIGIAIAIHNIPEGISVSMPIFYATGSRGKAFFWSAISGLTEPLGALIGLAVLGPFLDRSVLAGLLAFVAGVMIYLSVDELLPMAHRYGRGHTVIFGIVCGMAIMAASLLLI